MADAAAVMAAHLSEGEWQDQVLDLARLLGWFPYHTFDSRHSQPGFPDLVLVRERVVFAELKRQRERLKPAQVAWQGLLRAAAAEVYVWRPADFDQVRAILQRRGR